MAEELVGPEADHYVIEVAIKQVTWKSSQVSVAGSGRTVDGPRTRHSVTLTKLITTSGDVEAAVSKAKRVLDIEVGDDA